jgi:hypothetical protein
MVNLKHGYTKQCVLLGKWLVWVLLSLVRVIVQDVFYSKTKLSLTTLYNEDTSLIGYCTPCYISLNTVNILGILFNWYITENVPITAFDTATSFGVGATDLVSSCTDINTEHSCPLFTIVKKQAEAVRVGICMDGHQAHFTGWLANYMVQNCSAELHTAIMQQHSRFNIHLLCMYVVSVVDGTWHKMNIKGKLVLMTKSR